jgi:hypothetical protein
MALSFSRHVRGPLLESPVTEIQFANARRAQRFFVAGYGEWPSYAYRHPVWPARRLLQSGGGHDQDVNLPPVRTARIGEQTYVRPERAHRPIADCGAVVSG